MNSFTQLLVGPQVTSDGANPILRGGKSGEAIVQELHGRFYEQCYRGNTYRGGMTTLTSISNATFTIATTGVTATPIVGLYNPSTSLVNAVILQAILGITLTSLTATGGGPFLWAYSLGNGAVSTGSTPINSKTLVASGSACKVFGGAALTGMTGVLAALVGSALCGGASYNVSEVATAAGFMTPQMSDVENFDGSLIVPPGGVLALLATTTPVAHSAVSGLVWEEVAL